MPAIRHLFAAVLVLGSLYLLPGTARAAQSLDTCAGFIDTLPATIATQGVWCLRHDLATAITSGNAITIGTNNVTIDCNDFKIGGLAAGDFSTTTGIYAQSHQNATVRHCNVRGFYTGIYLSGGAGHLVEDNRLDYNLFTGIYLDADNSLVQRNRVFDTGPGPAYGSPYGINANSDLLDNTVSGVFSRATVPYPVGISANGSGTTVQGNRVRGLVVTGSGSATGIEANTSGITLDDNQVSTRRTTPGYGIKGVSSACSNNSVDHFSPNYYGCAASVNNISLP